MTSCPTLLHHGSPAMVDNRPQKSSIPKLFCVRHLTTAIRKVTNRDALQFFSSGLRFSSSGNAVGVIDHSREQVDSKANFHYLVKEVDPIARNMDFTEVTARGEKR